MISGCILAKNEQSLLAACIESIQELCDEIIVIDNGSTDNTRYIAESLGCKVYYDPTDDFDLLKDKFHDLATQEWIFSIDADERLSNGSANRIRETLKNSPKDVWGYTVPKLNYIGHGQWAESNFLEVYRNIKEICYTKTSIHASLKPSIQKNGKKVERLDTVVHHVDALVRDTKYKRDRYRKLIKENIEKVADDYGQKYHLLCFLGLEYMFTEEWDEAKKLFEECIQMYPNHRTMAYSYLSQLYYRLGQYEKSMELSEYVISAVEEKHKYAWFNVARNQLQLGNFEGAEKNLRTFIDLFPTSCTGYYNLAYVLWKEGKEYQAMLEKAFALNDMLGSNTIYEDRPKSIYLNQTIVFDFSDEYLNLLKDACTKG